MKNAHLQGQDYISMCNSRFHLDGLKLKSKHWSVYFSFPQVFDGYDSCMDRPRYICYQASLFPWRCVVMTIQFLCGLVTVAASPCFEGTALARNPRSQMREEKTNTSVDYCLVSLPGIYLWRGAEGSWKASLRQYPWYFLLYSWRILPPLSMVTSKNVSHTICDMIWVYCYIHAEWIDADISSQKHS